MKQRKEPIRMCAGCRDGRPKRELVRVVRTPSGEVCVDLTGRLAGRGAYLCRNEECLKRAMKSRALERSLQCTISEEVYTRLAQEISAAAQQVSEDEDG